MSREEKIGIYAGSFDPVTLGHMDIIERSSRMFDRLIVAVLVNKSKKPLFSIDERVTMIRSLASELPNVEVKSFEGLVVDFAVSEHATTLVRGLRAVTDFENELSMAQTNRTMCPQLDTVFLATDLKYAYLSSSVVKEVAAFGGKIDLFLPESVVPMVRAKYNTNNK